MIFPISERAGGWYSLLETCSISRDSAFDMTSNRKNARFKLQKSSRGLFLCSNTAVFASYKHIQKFVDGNRRLEFYSLKNVFFPDISDPGDGSWALDVLSGPTHPPISVPIRSEMVKMPASNFRNHSRSCFYVPIQLFCQVVNIFKNAETEVE